MSTAIETMLAVAEIGGRLRIAEDGTLRMLLPADCPPSLKADIRENKTALLELLNGPPFLIVRSNALHGQIVFWTADEPGRNLLIEHGASPGSVWTYAELDRVVRLSPDADGLNRLASVKRKFQGRILDER